MLKIIVKDLIDSNIAVSMPIGDKLYQKLLEVWDSSDSIEIDFMNIDTLATPFFNASIARLLKDHTIDNLQQKLKISNLSDGGRHLLNRVIDNAIAFYANPDRMAQLINTPVEE